MELTVKHYEMIDEIIDYTDFEKIHKAMVALDWGWAFGDDVSNLHIPEVSEIRRHARKLLKECVEKTKEDGDERSMTISTAGFTVYYNREDDYMSLKFVIEEADAYVNKDDK